MEAADIELDRGVNESNDLTADLLRAARRVRIDWLAAIDDELASRSMAANNAQVSGTFYF